MIRMLSLIHIYDLVVIDIKVNSHDITAFCITYGTNSAGILDLSYVSRMLEMIHYFKMCIRDRPYVIVHEVRRTCKQSRNDFRHFSLLCRYSRQIRMFSGPSHLRQSPQIPYIFFLNRKLRQFQILSHSLRY